MLGQLERQMPSSYPRPPSGIVRCDADYSRPVSPKARVRCPVACCDTAQRRPRDDHDLGLTCVVPCEDEQVYKMLPYIEMMSELDIQAFFTNNYI
jgi:hypothetical protein